RVKGSGVKDLAPLKQLRYLGLGSALTDANLKTLREVGLLHASSVMSGKGEGRPTGPDDVVSCSLEYTEITGAGLKEFAPLKRLQNLYLTPRQLNDEGLKGLRQVGLLHALLRAGGEG